MARVIRRHPHIELVKAGVPKKPRSEATGGREGREARSTALRILRQERGWKLPGSPPKRLGPGKPVKKP